MNINFKTAAVTGKNDSGKRADKIIRKVLSDLNLSSVYKEIRSGRIRINSRKIKPEYRVSEGDVISVHKSLLENLPSLEKGFKSGKTGNMVFSPETVKIAEDIKKDIIFENRNILAVNKKRGIPVHGGNFIKKTETLEDCIKIYLKGKIEQSLTFSPGPLHRLDRNTSGLVLFGKSIDGARIFSEMLRNGKTEKYYLALFDGKIGREVRWENRITQDNNQKKAVDADQDKSGKSKKAVTIVKPLLFNSRNTLALVNIPTGRYHQIRKQGQLNRHPLTGDKKYGGKPVIPCYLLHAYRIDLKEYSETTGFSSLKAPVPDYFINTAVRIFGDEAMEIFRIFIKTF